MSISVDPERCRIIKSPSSNLINDWWFIEWTNGVLEKLQTQMWRNLLVHKSVTHCIVAMLLNLAQGYAIENSLNFTS